MSETRTLREKIASLPRFDGHGLNNAGALIGRDAVLDAHQPAPDAVAEAADTDAAFKDGWGFAYRQWQRTGSVPDPDYTLAQGQRP